MQRKDQFLTIAILFILTTIAYNTLMIPNEKFIGNMSILNLNYILCCILIVVIAIYARKELQAYF